MIRGKIRKIKKEQWILLGLVGILIIISSIPVEEKDSTGKKNTEVLSFGEVLDEMEILEERLQKILSQMEGAGKVRVMITKKSSGEKIVEKDMPVSDREVQEKDENGNSSTVERDMDEVTVYEKDENGNQTPYVTRETAPEVEGVLVLAQGGGDAVVIKNITDAVMALFGLEAHKIKVMKML